jgi:pilus assembly protein CpaF
VNRSIVAELHDDLAAEHAPVDPERLVSEVARRRPLLGEDERASVVADVLARAGGLGPLESLLAAPEVTEVMVNGPGPVWVERSGRVERTSIELDVATIGIVIERIVGPLGLRVDRSVPIVDARLGDGSRACIVVPPLAVDGPYVTIRRFAPLPLTLADFGGPEVGHRLARAVARHRNIVVTGGTGAGKTSLLNALAAEVDEGERIVTVEDAAELALEHPHVVRLEARPANVDGVGEVSIRRLVLTALRMRPDRFVVGEVRGREALDMVQAMNTGHEGSLTTCHANSPEDALRRLVTMIVAADANLTVELATEHVLASLDLFVHVERSGDGRRRVSTVAEASRERGIHVVWKAVG